jgi:DNA-directed RNA polymerase specialized sigma24 family protein
LRAAARPQGGEVVLSRVSRSSTRPAPAAERRRLIRGALAGCPLRQRLVLALLLYERLSPAEAADALGCPEREVLRAYRALLAELRGVMRSNAPGRPSRRVARVARDRDARLRRAS